MRRPALLLLLALGSSCRRGYPNARPLIAPRPLAHHYSLAWRADLHVLATELAQRHKNAFFATPRDAFMREVARLDADIPRLDDIEIIYRMKRLVASLGDGHTGGPAVIVGERRLPVRFQWFAEGIAVTATAPAYARLLGARLVSVGEFAAAAAFDTLGQYDAADNVWGMRHRAPGYLSNATALAATHLVKAGEPVRMTFRTSNGGDTTVSFPWPPAPTPAATAAAPPTTSPAPARLPFKWRFVSEHNAIVLTYDDCSFGREFAMMTDTILRFIDSAKVRRVVVDVRANPGGSNQVAIPLIDGLAARSRVLPGSSVFVLMGRGTYSSGMDFAAQMRRTVHAVLVGEPTGGTPNGYGDVFQLILPNSRLFFQYSTKAFGVLGGPTMVEPDIPITITIDNFLTRRDVALETVLTR